MVILREELIEDAYKKLTPHGRKKAAKRGIRMTGIGRHFISPHDAIEYAVRQLNSYGKRKKKK